MQRRTVYYSGQVQGVGFRYTATRAAAGLDVTGYVRNLQDGRVELVAEGEPAALDLLLAEVRRQLEGNITGSDEATGPATGEFTVFEVRR